MTPDKVNVKDIHYLPRTYSGLLGYSWLGHPELLSVIPQLPHTGTLVEVGTASGVTAALFSASRPELQLVCLDTFVEAPAHLPTDRPDCRSGADRRNDWRHNATPRMVLLEQTLADFAKSIRIADMAVFIDGDHSYEGVVADLAVCEEYLPEVIFCHDYGDPHWTGVKRAVDEFLIRCPVYGLTNKCNSAITLRKK